MKKNSMMVRFKEATYHKNWDAWGESLGMLFNVCEYMLINDIDIPGKWGFRPSPFASLDESSESLKDSIWLFEGETTESVINFGNILHKYTNFLRYKGEDY